VNAAGACILPAADLTYVATRWDGVTEPFGRAFLPGFAALALCGLIARALGAGNPSARPSAGRRRATRNNVVFVAVVIVSVSSGRVFGNQIAWLLGAFATLACFFALVCLLANGSSSRQTRGLRADWAFGDLKPSRLRAGRAPT
jgi:hypothetical protein